jgi:hypothetical protein
MVIALMVVNQLLKYMMKNDIFFGGKDIILEGDLDKFYQLSHMDLDSLQYKLVYRNYLIWPHFKIFKLFRNMRLNQN